MSLVPKAISKMIAEMSLISDNIISEIYNLPVPCTYPKKETAFFGCIDQLCYLTPYILPTKCHCTSELGKKERGP